MSYEVIPTTETNHTLGKNIKVFRSEMGLSQQQIADYLGISRVEVSYYETGSRTAPTELISKLAGLFGVTEYELLEESPEHNKVKMALAFRTDKLKGEDLQAIAGFKKIVMNYLQMKKKLANESNDS